MQGSARAAARRSQRSQPLRRPGGRQGVNSAIQGRPGGLTQAAPGPGGAPGGVRRLLRTRPCSRNVPGGVYAPPDVPTRSSQSAQLPGRPPTEMADGCPAPPTRLARAHRPSQHRRGPHRGSASRASPGGGLSSPARQLLEPPPRPRRPSAHGCGRRVALLVAFRAPPPERPRVHWPAAPCPRSLARSTPALIGPSHPGAVPLRPAPLGRRPLNCLPGSGLLPGLKCNWLCESPTK